ncbi:hypothetical protein ACFE04_016286 [Oxalis oulophora]
MFATSSSSSANTTMITIAEKKTTNIDFYTPLLNYITGNYSDRIAADSKHDLETLKQLRSDIERTSDPTPSTRRDLYIAYYKVLTQVEPRFPISNDKYHINNVSFVWFDSFKPRLKAVQQSIQLEKAAVLFNLGAVYCQIGCSFDRCSPTAGVEGSRQASHAFIAAAGVYAMLKDNVASIASSSSSVTVDLSVECARMLEKLMLAQAQECVFENAVAKGSSHGVCAKVSRQVGLYYEEVLGAVNVAPLKDHFERGWISHVQLKVSLFYAEACHRCSLELHEKEEIGEEIARLRSGITALADVKRLGLRGAPNQIYDAINKLEVVLNRNLEIAVKENDSVYLERVPNIANLVPLPAFSLVKPMPMNDVLDASKEKLFATVVPDNSTKALSRYTEMVDSIIRTQAEKLQQGSELARVRLKDMDLPDSIFSLEGSLTLPESLKEDVEAVQISGGPAGLEAEMQQLKDLRKVNQELLVQTEELLKKEAGEDAHFRSQFGTRWTRPHSSTLTKNMLDRLNRFAANLKQAADSDSRIERSVRDHYALMSILDRRPIEAALPSLAKPIMSLNSNEDAIIGALKQSLRQLETLGAQRAGLEDMLKDMKLKDDILPKLMTSTGSFEDLFRKEIAKYDDICQEIARNIDAQEQLLLQIQAQNNEFSATFNLEDYQVSRDKCFKQIQAAIAKYREIKENFNEGLKFYVTLQDAITSIKQQCSDFAMTRNMQCREMVEDLQKQMTGLNFQDRMSSSSAAQPPYGSHRQPSPYHVPPTTGSPYPPPHTQQQPPGSHDYVQPPHPVWRGPQPPYNGQQPPYNGQQPPYPPYQGGYYRQQ